MDTPLEQRMMDAIDALMAKWGWGSDPALRRMLQLAWIDGQADGLEVGRVIHEQVYGKAHA